MSIRIDCNGKEILHISNSYFDALYSEIVEIVENKNIELSPAVEIIIKRLDQGTYGAGMVSIDIEKYLNQKEDVFSFAQLVSVAMTSLKSKSYFSLTACEILSSFHDELVKYGQELS